MNYEREAHASCVAVSRTYPLPQIATQKKSTTGAPLLRLLAHIQQHTHAGKHHKQT
jgi:hypothetical protein